MLRRKSKLDDVCMVDCTVIHVDGNRIAIQLIILIPENRLCVHI